MMETDLLLMSLCIFLPSVFALLVLFIPKGAVEAIRWFTLLGTACTFVVTTMVFINYLNMLNLSTDPTGRAAKSTTLLERAGTGEARELKGEPPLAEDQLSRLPWISRFNIDYYIGIDGISLTVNQVDGAGFAVSIIPHTQVATTLTTKPVGGEVNLEVDLIGKYVEKLVGPHAASTGLTLQKLSENGFV